MKISQFSILTSCSGVVQWFECKGFCCRLNFTVAETFGEEEESILQTAKLWQNNISAIIGPIETCVHEVKLDISRRLIGQLKPAID